jgi:predicted permease
VALSLVLLVGATLFLRSLQNATSIDIGMRADNILLLAFDPKLQQYSKEKSTQFLDQLRDRVTALPGIKTVSYLDSIPLSIGGTNFDLRVADKADAKTSNADIYNVGERYFETVGVPLLQGREFSRGRDKNAAILNEKLAREMFGNANPIGRHISSREGPEKRSDYEVIGIARNSKSRTIGEEQHNVAYLFLENAPEQVMSFYGISLAAKTAGPPRRFESAIRAEIRKLDPNLPVFGIETMQEHVDKSMLLPRLCATLLGVFGGVGLILATVGLYGVISYSVRSRTREIGIRLALGAESRRVIRMVLQQGLGLVVAGLLAGLALAFVLGRFAASLLYGVSGTDTFTFVFVPFALVMVGTAAILIPARRASRVDPMGALRYE